jgi:hypothetical protein
LRRPPQREQAQDIEASICRIIPLDIAVQQIVQ